jgi:hypothetical protein
MVLAVYTLKLTSATNLGAFLSLYVSKSLYSVVVSVTFFSNTTALIGIAILLNVVCISMAREKKYSSPPKMLKNFFSGCGGRFLCLGNYTHQVLFGHIITFPLSTLTRSILKLSTLL